MKRGKFQRFGAFRQLDGGNPGKFPKFGMFQQVDGGKLWKIPKIWGVLVAGWGKNSPNPNEKGKIPAISAAGFGKILVNWGKIPYFFHIMQTQGITLGFLGTKMAIFGLQILGCFAPDTGREFLWDFWGQK